MVVEGDGRGFLGGGLLGGLAEGAQIGPDGADGDQKSQDPADRHDPHPQPEFILKPDSQHQKKTQGEQDGKSKLGHPDQKVQEFHVASKMTNGHNACNNSKLLYKSFSKDSRHILK